MTMVEPSGSGLQDVNDLAPLVVSRLPVGSSAAAGGLADDGAGDGRALLLPAGQLVRVVAAAVADSDAVHGFGHPALAVLGHALAMGQAQLRCSRRRSVRRSG